MRPLVSHPISVTLAWLLPAIAALAQPGPIRIFTPITITEAPPAVIIMNPDKATNTSMLRLSNGDSLQGKLLSIDAGKQVRWENPNIRPVMQLSASNISRIRLASPASERPQSNGNCVLRLLNGDQFTGNLVSMDADKLVLDTWYAGQLTLPRKQLRWLRSTQGNSLSYAGPTGMDGWTISASAELADEKVPAWGYSSGVFFARKAGGIARDVKLPDRAALDMDVAWRQYLQLTITIYTDSLQVYRLGSIIGGGMIIGGPGVGNGANAQPGGGFYAIHLNQNGCYLLTVRKNGETSNSPLEMIPGLDQKNRVRIGLRVDKMQKTISLLVDGKVVKTWQEAGEFAGRGTAIRLVQQGVAPLNLSHISIGPWDGVLDKLPGQVSTGTNDFVQLKNQDAFPAALKTIHNGAVVAQTSFGPLKVPMDRITEINLANPGEKAPPPPSGAVKAYFAHTDGSIVCNIEQWDPTKVTVTSPVFGRVQFNPAAFSMLEFTPSPAATPR